MKSFIILLLMVVVPTIVLLGSVSGMAIDEMIADAAGSDSEMSFSFDDGREVIRLEYDILMSFDDYNKLQRRESGQRKKRTTVIKHDLPYPRMWEDAVVYYEILPHFDERETAMIHQAIGEWERYTCIDFREDNVNNRRIQFKNGPGCMSQIGMASRPQGIILGHGCLYMSVILHEIGHALGLFHEQTRPDRDEYVSVLRRNVAPDMFYNFKKNSWATVENTGIPYDYTSIMHYGKKAFSRNGQLTIQTADPAYQDKIGKMKSLSFRDVKTINQFYSCAYGCSLQDSDCPGEGFVGKDCTCLCPGQDNDVNDAKSVIPCEESPMPTTSTTTERTDVRTFDPIPTAPRPTPRPEEEVCRDVHAACQSWHNRGYCNGRNQEIVRSKCKQTCGLCPEGIVQGSTPRPTTPRPDGSCRDTRRACRAWNRRDYCHGNIRWRRKLVRAKCPLTCGICGK